MVLSSVSRKALEHVPTAAQMGFFYLMSLVQEKQCSMTHSLAVSVMSLVQIVAIYSRPCKTY